MVHRTGLLALAGPEAASPGALSSALTALPSMLSHIGGPPAALRRSPSANSRALLSMIAAALSSLHGSSACDACQSMSRYVVPQARLADV